MGTNISSKLGQLLIVLLLLCTLLSRTEAALPSSHQTFLQTGPGLGRRVMIQRPVRPSQSGQAGGRDHDDDPPSTTD